MAVKRQCKCCGKEYEFCPNCAKKDQPQWMVSFCSESCKGLFNVVAAYNMKRANKATVQKYVTDNHVAGRYTAPIEKVLEEVRGVNSTPTENQSLYESTAKTADTVIPIHKMESQSKPRFKRRKRR